MDRKGIHLKSVLIAVFVTFLWSTSWVFIKYGLGEIPPIIFAAMRYGIASIALLPFVLNKKCFNIVKQMGKKSWLLIISLGIAHYTLTQGAQFIALNHLPASMVTLLLNFTTVLVALMGYAFLSEGVTKQKIIGITINIIGIVIFFLPNNTIVIHIFGLIIALLGVFFNAVSSILGRHINRGGVYPPVLVTFLSMTIGAMLLFTTSNIAQETLPNLNGIQITMVLWLAIVNTAFAFTLWNYSLRHLSATESSVTTNTMPIQITLMVAIFYGEEISLIGMVGIILTCVGTFIVQFKPRRKKVTVDKPDLTKVAVSPRKREGIK